MQLGSVVTLDIEKPAAGGRMLARREFDPDGYGKHALAVERFEGFSTAFVCGADGVQWTSRDRG